MTTNISRFEAKLNAYRNLRGFEGACIVSSVLGRSMESKPCSMPFLSSSMVERLGSGLSSYGFVPTILKILSVKYGIYSCKSRRRRRGMARLHYQASKDGVLVTEEKIALVCHRKTSTSSQLLGPGEGVWIRLNLEAKASMLLNSPIM